ncbi:hypothetical protein [Chryseobacterium arthrosphaerae]|uniref:hypothetical protein n=1 Tax=Chryseobacterium arthrosphaerae TaxID=651561 RepID=UPI0013F4D9A3|nr:hypothetical protein [Chryseobacterium arthrosphaerae]QUY55909.1 hypothetical protein I2F65_00625 [Chryseobacterium arthrosphaerae]
MKKMKAGGLEMEVLLSINTILVNQFFLHAKIVPSSFRDLHSGLDSAVTKYY